jgi:CRP/FNR family cyclic AMP-dependent transcriptional regulator
LGTEAPILGGKQVSRPKAPVKTPLKAPAHSLLTRFASGQASIKSTTLPIFRQGEPSDSLYYIESGKVKLSVVSQRGKEAVVEILSEGDFLGESCLAGEVRRAFTAEPLGECVVVRLDKSRAQRAFREDQNFQELFLAHLLSRNMRIQDDLADHLFNSSERRLARTLLILSDCANGKPKPIVGISQETLAEMIGTTRSRVNYFMNKFRKLGFIHYDGHLEVHSSLQSVLHD